jgi:hypothetical protein
LIYHFHAKENRDESVDVDKRSNEIDEEIDVESVEVVNQQKQSPNARSKRLKTENLVQTEKKENKAITTTSCGKLVVPCILAICLSNRAFLMK